MAAFSMLGALPPWTGLHGLSSTAEKVPSLLHFGMVGAGPHLMGSQTSGVVKCPLSGHSVVNFVGAPTFPPIVYPSKHSYSTFSSNSMDMLCDLMCVNGNTTGAPHDTFWHVIMPS